jgi:hypothetical protein
MTYGAILVGGMAEQRYDGRGLGKLRKRTPVAGSTYTALYSTTIRALQRLPYSPSRTIKLYEMFVVPLRKRKLTNARAKRPGLQARAG